VGFLRVKHAPWLSGSRFKSSVGTCAAQKMQRFPHRDSLLAAPFGF
jgi:hypothetical protein